MWQIIKLAMKSRVDFGHFVISVETITGLYIAAVFTSTSAQTKALCKAKPTAHQLSSIANI